MSGPRVAFADSTNSGRGPRYTSNRFMSKLSSSRKSAPTCTVSLANVSSNDLCIDLTSAPSSSPISSTSFIPFPSSPVECPASTISQSDRTFLLLLRSSSETPSQPDASSPSSEFPISHERRKRATTRLLPVIPTNLIHSEQSPNVKTFKPPRKRPRLQTDKTASRIIPLNAADLRFLAMVQRSVAGVVVERRTAFQRRRNEELQRASFFEAQDELLVRNLREKLLSEGWKAADLLDLDSEPLMELLMDVDMDECLASVTSDDMDIVVECAARCAPAPSPVLSSPPTLSSALYLDNVKSASQLVATHLMRHRMRQSSRANVREACRPFERKPSPLSVSFC